MRTALLSTLAAAVFLLGSGCSNGTPTDPPNPDGGTDGGTLEFTEFARDLILNNTNDSALPEPIDGKQFTDSESQNAFPASFFTP